MSHDFAIDPHEIFPDPKNWDSVALFLDFDGTLVELADEPAAIIVKPQLIEALAALDRDLSGALAVVTGRDISDLDRWLHPLRLPVAGVHGLTRRDAQGKLLSRPYDPGVAERIAGRLEKFVATTPGLALEQKTGAVVLHYRLRPDCEERCLAAMVKAVEGVADVHLMRGKMNIEARPVNIGKGEAIAEFLAERPFRGRRPVFAGDDLTDEDAFAEVNRRGGITIKVGEGDTHARYRVATAVQFQDWLIRLARGLPTRELSRERA